MNADAHYSAIVRRILDTGDRRVDRTGVGTLSVFGVTARFDLSQGEVPLITTKRVSWKTAVKEMLWFLTGGTNIRALLEQNVRIWTDWPLARYRRETGDDIAQADFEARILADEDFAARMGRARPGLRQAMAPLARRDGREHDQIAAVVEQLRSNPASRRILFHGWNVPELPDMALPPCHMVYQYHVTGDGRLNSLLFQRRCDAMLGAAVQLGRRDRAPADAGAAGGLAPGELVWMGGDVHLYLNHLDQAREQLARAPRAAPR